MMENTTSPQPTDSDTVMAETTSPEPTDLDIEMADMTNMEPIDSDISMAETTSMATTPTATKTTGTEQLPRKYWPFGMNEEDLKNLAKQCDTKTTPRECNQCLLDMVRSIEARSLRAQHQVAGSVLYDQFQDDSDFNRSWQRVERPKGKEDDINVPNLISIRSDPAEDEYRRDSDPVSILPRDSGCASLIETRAQVTTIIFKTWERQFSWRWGTLGVSIPPRIEKQNIFYAHFRFWKTKVPRDQSTQPMQA